MLLLVNHCVLSMATILNSGNEREGSITALEGACLFDNVGSPMEQTPLELVRRLLHPHG